jgi:hypothetical protein
MKSEKCVPERPLGVNFSHALRHATSGMSAEYVAFWLKSAGNETALMLAPAL